MKYQFIDEHRSAFRVRKMCQVMGLTTSGYYSWKKRGKSKRTEDNEKLDMAIKHAYRKSRGNYGSPRITKELQSQGICCSKNRVARRMKENKIVAKTKRRFKITTKSKHKNPVAENILNQNFETRKPDKVWASDITYIRTREGWLYLSVILDLFSRQVVGWSMSNRLTQDLVIKAFQQAVWRRNPEPGLIFHSDQGIQYACQPFRNLLAKHNFIQSMSRKGNCYDNAVVESFFHTLKTELIYFEAYQTRDEAKKSVFDYIEIFYNRERRHSTLNYLSPVDYESLARVA